MPGELTIIPAALANLRRVLDATDATVEDLLLPLRALQRLGLKQAELQVHLERMRAINEVTADDETVEDNALLALDLISGEIAGNSLRWDAAETAKIFLPRALTNDALGRSISSALGPSNMLPPRPGWDLPSDLRAALVEGLQIRIREFEREPKRADFFRVPKAGMTTRPAALLAPEDRLIYQGLAEEISARLDAQLPPTVVWPRAQGDDDAARHDEFASMPEGWGGNYVVVTDIESFYECVDHTLLANFVSTRLHAGTPYLRTIESFLTAVMGSETGLPQGPAASEVFASAYLLPIDLLMYEGGWVYSRYADDYLISADSIVDGRRKLEQLEMLFREVGLRLNVAKTKVMRRATYLGTLGKPSRRVVRFRERIRVLAEAKLRESEDPEEVESVLRGLGVDEEILWDLLYHRTTTIDEVIESIRDQLRPPLIEAYRHYFEEAARRLSRDRLPEDMLSAEKDLRECLVFLAGAGQVVELQLVDQVLKWFPRLARHTAAYLKSVASVATPDVAALLRRWLEPAADTDWVTAWLCYVPESSPELVVQGLEPTLRQLVRSSAAGYLTRTGAVRALAAARRLDEESWVMLLEEASPAIRSELLLARLGEPDRYPGGPQALEQGDLS